MTSVRWDPSDAMKELRKAHAAALTDVAEAVLEQANRHVPIEEMTLGGSGTVSSTGGDVTRTLGGPAFTATRVGTVRPAGRIELAVSYDTPYAVRQHEDTSLTHDPGRTAKWLERATNDMRADAVDYVAARLRKALR